MESMFPDEMTRSLSPRMKWMIENGITLHQEGETWRAERQSDNRRDISRGVSQDDALLGLAFKLNLRNWKQ